MYKMTIHDSFTEFLLKTSQQQYFNSLFQVECLKKVGDARSNEVIRILHQEM